MRDDHKLRRRFEVPESLGRIARLSFRLGLIAATFVGVQSASVAFGAIARDSFLANAITSNALLSNTRTINALTSQPLTAKSIESSSLVSKALADPDAQEVLKAIVSCALPESKTLTIATQGRTNSYPGELGLASSWGTSDGACDSACQQVVSACILSRIDITGADREVSLRGANAGLQVTAAEAQAYTVREAAFFGNLFKHPQQRYACLSPGQTEIERVCGASLEDCVVSVDPTVTCEDVCTHPSTSGAFRECRPGDGASDDPPHIAVTSYLRSGEP